MRIAITVGVGILIGLAAWLWRPYSQSRAASKVYNQFVEHVEKGDWASASAMMSPDGECAIVNERVIVFSYADITNQIGPTNPKWIAMIDHHRNRIPWEGPKYIFEMGYALIDLEHDQIKRIKLP
jgi:hypothetical protein